MSGNLNVTFPTHIVKFEGVDPPDGYKVADYSNYMPVKSFTRAGHHSTGETIRRADGLHPIQQCDPVYIALDEKMMARVSKLCGQGFLDKKIHCIELARGKGNKHVPSFEMELEDVMVDRNGDGVIVQYQKYTDKSHNGDEAPDEGGYDFLEQERLD